MELNINITTDLYCHVLVKDSSTYLDEYNTSINPSKLKFSDTISIISISHSDTREDKLEYYHIKKHTTTSFRIPINFDGVFTASYIVLPTKEWYTRVLASVSKQDLLKAFGGRIVIYDGTLIIEITSNSEEYIPISDFILSGYSDNLSVSIRKLELLAICRLRKCYINLCLQIFDSKNFSPCWNKNKIDSELVYKRDLAWMTINLITYLWKQGKSNSEILRILSQVNKCNGLCDPYPNNLTEKNNGCGCSSK